MNQEIAAIIFKIFKLAANHQSSLFFQLIIADGLRRSSVKMFQLRNTCWSLFRMNKMRLIDQ